MFVSKLLSLLLSELIMSLFVVISVAFIAEILKIHIIKDNSSIYNFLSSICEKHLFCILINIIIKYFNNNCIFLLINIVKNNFCLSML